MTHAKPGAGATHILVADDEGSMRSFVADVLRQDGYTVSEYDPLSPQPDLLLQPYDVAVLDIVMPGADGFELRRRMLPHCSAAEFIFMTGFPDREKHRLATDLGVLSFLVKPFRADHIRYAVMSAVDRKKLFTPGIPERQGTHVPGVVGTSHQTETVRRRIAELGPSPLPVLITGESGTGKELVARGLHACSPRREGPFIAVNCGGLTPSLIESELFGHAQGAFTGAHRTKHGLFEAADQGTLFLDEIAELPLELQSKFLRVLDTGEFIRVGENKPRKADVRIVSATNRDLQHLVEQAKFRGDLFYRLKGSRINLRPLRERKEDVPPLVKHFAGADTAVTDAAMRAFVSFDWPGNVRELAMMVAAVKACRGGGEIDEATVRRVVTAHYGCEDSDRVLTYKESKERILRNFESEYFAQILRCAGGNMTRAATLAGMDRKNLREKLKQAGIYQAVRESAED